MKEIKDGNSIIAFWVERPKAVSENEVRFSGIIPGGYTEKKGLIFSMIFQAQTEGGGIVEIHDARALRNDGKGTEADTTISDLQFVVSGKAAVPKAPIEKKDIEPPEVFEPIISQNETMFEGGYFLVFVTQDKGSGIDYCKVCEGKRQCVIAESPYLLQNQNLNNEIIVKAIDKSGNERVVVLPPQKPKPSYKNYLLFAILIMGVFFVAYIIWRFLWKKHRKQNF
ncbi:MAG: hypothetical protein KKD35_01605 [Elusimicrobia bacterium]|nr:hypothetical protein [Elusimicrobiota bacterium]